MFAVTLYELGTLQTFCLVLSPQTCGYYHPHFAGVETESGRDEVTYSR